MSERAEDGRRASPRRRPFWIFVAAMVLAVAGGATLVVLARRSAAGRIVNEAPLLTSPAKREAAARGAPSGDPRPVEPAPGPAAAPPPR
jgi:hypothetical protein